MKQAFTLIELLVVIGIMGLLGTASVGGYRAMQRGMADRGVMENVNKFIRTAYQRAQIDRQPVVVYFWNETLREEDMQGDAVALVVGKAVAVRRHGRFSYVSGEMLYDEFADLKDIYGESDDNASQTSSDENTLYLYPVDRLTDLDGSGNLKRSKVFGTVFPHTQSAVRYLSSDNLALTDEADSGRITMYGFKVEDAGNIQWEQGMAYGFEFAELELPHGYVFGSGDGAYSKQISKPIREIGALVFDVAKIQDNNGITATSGKQAGFIGNSTVTVSALRPGDDGAITVKEVAVSDPPTKDL